MLSKDWTTNFCRFALLVLLALPFFITAAPAIAAPTSKIAVIRFSYDKGVQSANPKFVGGALKAMNLMGGLSVYADGKKVGYYFLEQTVEIEIPAGSKNIYLSNEPKIWTPTKIFGYQKYGPFDVSKYRPGKRFYMDCDFDLLKSFSQFNKNRGNWSVNCSLSSKKFLN